MKQMSYHLIVIILLKIMFYHEEPLEQEFDWDLQADDMILQDCLEELAGAPKANDEDSIVF